MVNQQMLDYIKQQVQQGVSREQIKSSLMTNGWQASDIEEGFNAIGSGSSNIPLAPLANVGPTSNFTNSVTPISYAGFWLRVAASLVDGFIVNLIFAILGISYFWFFAKNNPSLSNSTQTVMGILYFVIWIFYFPFMESRGGTTFGKKIVGIKVLNANGEPVGFLRSLGRNLAKIISALILMIGFIMAGFTKKKQGLHDIIASCVVVRSRETSAGKIWAVVILIIVVSIGTVVIAGAQFLFMLSSLFSGGIKIQTSSTNPSVIQFQNNGNSDNSTNQKPATPATTDTPLGSVAQANNFSIKVAKVIPNPKTTGDQADAGMEYIEIILDITNTGTQTNSISGNNFYYMTTSGQEIGTANTFGTNAANKNVEIPNQKPLVADFLKPQQNDSSSYLIYQIPTGDLGKLIWHENMFDTTSTKLAIFDLK